jgi:hypothetical protein
VSANDRSQHSRLRNLLGLCFQQIRILRHKVCELTRNELALIRFHAFGIGRRLGVSASLSMNLARKQETHAFQPTIQVESHCPMRLTALLRYFPQEITFKLVETDHSPPGFVPSVEHTMDPFGVFLSRP